MKYSKTFISVLLLTTCSSIYGQNIDTSRIEIKTNKTDYSDNETVLLSVTNISIDTLYIYKPIFRSLELEIEKNNKWETVDFKYPYNGISILVPLSPAQTESFNWDQTINIKGQWPKRMKVTKGIYRFKLHFWNSQDIPNPWTNDEQGHFYLYSKEIKIE